MIQQNSVVALNRLKSEKATQIQQKVQKQKFPVSLKSIQSVKNQSGLHLMLHSAPSCSWVIIRLPSTFPPCSPVYGQGATLSPWCCMPQALQSGQGHHWVSFRFSGISHKVFCFHLNVPQLFPWNSTWNLSLKSEDEALFITLCSTAAIKSSWRSCKSTELF